MEETKTIDSVIMDGTGDSGQTLDLVLLLAGATASVTIDRSKQQEIHDAIFGIYSKFSAGERVCCVFGIQGLDGRYMNVALAHLRVWYFTDFSQQRAIDKARLSIEKSKMELLSQSLEIQKKALRDEQRGEDWKG